MKDYGIKRIGDERQKPYPEWYLFLPWNQLPWKVEFDVELMLDEHRF